MKPVTPAAFNEAIHEYFELYFGVGAIHVPTVLAPNLELVQDLGLDDLDKVELVMLLEDEFEMEFDDVTWDKFMTVGDLYRSLKQIVDQSIKSDLEPERNIEKDI